MYIEGYQFEARLFEVTVVFLNEKEEQLKKKEIPCSSFSRHNGSPWASSHCVSYCMYMAVSEPLEALSDILLGPPLQSYL